MARLQAVGDGSQHERTGRHGFQVAAGELHDDAHVVRRRSQQLRSRLHRPADDVAGSRMRRCGSVQLYTESPQDQRSARGTLGILSQGLCKRLRLVSKSRFDQPDTRFVRKAAHVHGP